MAQNTNLQESYSPIVEAKLRATSVFANLFNNKYEGVPTAGAVKIPVRSDATASQYNIATGVTLNAPATTYETLVLDNDYAVNELIDGYVAEAVPDGLVAERLDSAGYAMADQIDNDLVAELCKTANHTASASIATDAVDIIIDDIAQAKKAKVNPRSMWVVVSPDEEAEIMKSAYFKGIAHTADLEAGLIGRINGVPVYTSVNMPTGKKHIVGNSDFCHFVETWKVPAQLNDIKDAAHIGASAVQGRSIYGYKVTKKATVIVK